MKITNQLYVTFRFILLLCAYMVFSVSTAYAQDAQVLSVTPPLFQLSVEPGDVWQSTIKVVNSNSYPLTIYAEVVNFKPTGEDGQGSFLPLIQEDVDKTTLAHWIEISKESRVIPPEQTTDVSFFVAVPEDAPPGGHYAAILISTQPPEDDSQMMAVHTQQTVTSLFFVRVSGDIQEVGTIREFRTLDWIIPRPEAEFSLRFENKGNVHLQPRGNIIITNMWGTERGIIPINNQTHFGNVLPESIRDFKFAWESDFSITDVGRYKAIVTLGYGEDGIKSISSVTYFWVIPIKITLITLLVLGLFISLIVWMIKLYVRRMLLLAGVDPHRSDTSGHVQEEIQERNEVRVQNSRYARVSAPLKKGVLDLRQNIKKSEETLDIVRGGIHFAVLYKKFFFSIALLIVMFISAVLYIGKATEESTNYRVIIDEGDSERTLEGADIESVEMKQID